MKQWSAVVLAVGLAIGASACAGDRSPSADTKDTQGAPVGTAGAASDSDREFVSDQLSMGQAEIELGKLAQERGTHPAVKRFGAMMVRDHQDAGDQLKRTTKNTSAHGTPGEHTDHSDVREELAKLSGSDFDRRYIDQMISDHEKGIRDVEAKAEKSDSPQVREWAAKTLPTMRQHLEEAQNIKKTLENAPRNDK